MKELHQRPFLAPPRPGSLPGVIDMSPRFDGRFIALGFYVNTPDTKEAFVKRLTIVMESQNRSHVCLQQLPFSREAWKQLGLPEQFDNFYGFNMYANTDMELPTLIGRLKRSLDALLAIFDVKICAGPDASAVWAEIAKSIMMDPNVVVM